MGSLLLSFAIIFSLLQMFCGDFTSLLAHSKGTDEEEAEERNDAELINEKDSFEAGESPFKKDYPIYAQRQFSRVWHGSDGIAPVSIENMDRDDCERPQDWEGLQDPFEYDDEFTSSNLKRRSVSDEITSFDKCKQGDDYFVHKRDFSPENNSANKNLDLNKNTGSLKLPTVFNSYQDLDAFSENDKLKPLIATYPNSSTKSSGQEFLFSPMRDDMFEDGENFIDPESDPVESHSHQKLNYKRSSEKAEKKQKKGQKKEQEKLEKTIKNLKKGGPVLNAWFVESKKNEKTVEKIDAKKRTQKSIQEYKNYRRHLKEKTVSDTDNKKSSNETISEDYDSTDRNNMESNVNNDQNSRFRSHKLKRALPANILQDPAQRASNTLFSPEIFVNPIVLTTDADGENDEESVTVKVYQSAVRRANNTSPGELFVPNLEKRFEPRAIPLENEDLTLSTVQLNSMLNETDKLVADVESENLGMPVLSAIVSDDARGSENVLVNESNIGSKLVNTLQMPRAMFDLNAQRLREIQLDKSLKGSVNANPTSNKVLAPNLMNAYGITANEIARPLSYREGVTAKILNNPVAMRVQMLVPIEVKSAPISQTMNNLTAPLNGVVSPDLSGKAVTTNVVNKATQLPDTPYRDVVSSSANKLVGPFNGSPSNRLAAQNFANFNVKINEHVTPSSKTAVSSSSKNSDVSLPGSIILLSDNENSDSAKKSVVPTSLNDKLQSTNNSALPADFMNTNIKVNVSDNVSGTSTATPPATKKLAALSIEVIPPNVPVNLTETSSKLFPAGVSNNLTATFNEAVVVLATNNLNRVTNETTVPSEKNNFTTKNEANKLAPHSKESPHENPQANDAHADNNFILVAKEATGSSTSKLTSTNLVSVTPKEAISVAPSVTNKVKIFSNDAVLPQIAHKLVESSNEDHLFNNLSAPLNLIALENNNPTVSSTKGFDQVKSLNATSSDTSRSIFKNIINLNDFKAAANPYSDENVRNEKFLDEGGSVFEMDGIPASAKIDVPPESLKSKDVRKREVPKYAGGDFEETNSEAIIDTDSKNPFSKRNIGAESDFMSSDTHNRAHLKSNKESHFDTARWMSKNNFNLGRMSYFANIRSDLEGGMSKQSSNANLQKSRSRFADFSRPCSRDYQRSEFSRSRVQPNDIENDDKFHSMPRPKIDEASFYSSQNGKDGFEESLSIGSAKESEVPRKIAQRKFGPVASIQHSVNGKHSDDSIKIINPFEPSTKRPFSKELKETFSQPKSNVVKEAKSEPKIPAEVKDLLSGSGVKTSTDEPFSTGDGPDEVEMKVEDIMSGKVPNQLVDSILAKVDGCGKMGKELGLGSPASSCYENIDDMTVPISERENEVKIQAEKMMEIIMKQITLLIKDTTRKQGCYTLKPDLFSFLKWLLTPTPKNSKTCKETNSCKAQRFK